MTRHTLLGAVLLAGLVSSTLSAQITGIVIDSVSGQPIDGAIVTVQRTSTRATADSIGLFTIPGVTGAGIEIVGSAKGYYSFGQTVNAPAGGVQFLLEPVVVGNNSNYFFLAPSTCSGCHGTQWEQWNRSPMGNTGTNEWVHDLFAGNGTPGGMNGFVYQRDSAHAATVPNSTCAACHQPEVWVKNPGVALEPMAGMSVNAVHGVSCEACHKVADIDLAFKNSHGHTAPSVTFNLPNDPIQTHQVEYGVLGDVDFFVSGLMRASYQPQLVAEMCASCHQYNNDHDEDGDFEEPGSPEGQATFEEWQNSPYSDPASPLHATCVDCHMPAYGSDEVCGLGLPPRPVSQPRQHEIRGTSAQFLENAVDLAMNVVDAGSALNVQVDITNSMAGHKVPTGVSPRNMILIVEAFRIEDGVELAHSGTQVVDSLGGQGARIFGNYAGVAGKTYMKVNNDANGGIAPLFTESVTLRYDTRIPPLATDTTSYTFQKPVIGGGTLQVRARLIYRRAPRELVLAKGWTLNGRGEYLPDVHAPYYGHLMEEANWVTPGGSTAAVSTFGTGCNGHTISAIGEPFAGNVEFGIALSGAQVVTPAGLILSFDNQTKHGAGLPIDLSALGAPGCFLNVSTRVVLDTFTDTNGNAAIGFELPPWTPAGVEFFAQWIALDPSNALGVSSSDGLAVITTR